MAIPYHGVAFYNTSPEIIDFVRRNPIKPGRHTITARVALERRTIHVADLQADPEYEYVKRDVDPIRTELGVPMFRGNDLVGVIILYKLVVQPFTDKQIELVTTFADQAVIAIENVRLFEAEQQRTRELSESLEQQTATSEVLRVISSSPGDLHPVFEAMLAQAVRVCDAMGGGICRWDGEALHHVAVRWVEPAFAELLRRTPIHPNPNTNVGRMLTTKTVVHIPDLAAQPAYVEEREPGIVTAVEVGRVRTLVAVPMLKGDELIGAFLLTRKEVRPFTDKQIELVQNFAAQAVIAIENARLLNELRQRTTDLTESLDRQTATSEVLRVISTSSGDMKPVFEAMLANALRLCEAKFGHVLRYDGERYHAAHLHDVPPSYRHFWEQHGPLLPSPNTGLARLARTKQVTHIPDLKADPAYAEREPLRVITVEEAGARTLLAVPMVTENKLVGAIVIYRKEVQPFSDKQIELVKNFAAQAVIAIENARLLNELRQRTDDLTERTTDLTEALDQQTAMSEVLQVISSSPGELQPVFAAMLEKAVRICDAKSGIIYRREGSGFHLVATHNLPPAYAEARRLSPQHGLGPNSLLGRMVATKAIVHVADLPSEKGYTEQRVPETVAGVELGGVRTALIVPMLKDNELVGGFSLARQVVRPFADKQIEVVKNFAAQAAIAIENARLLNELRQRTEELGQSVGELRALGEVSKVVNSTLELETVLSTIVANAVRLSGTEAGAIYVFDEGQREFHLRATYGMDRQLIEALTQRHIGLDEPNITPAFLAGEPIQVPDLREALSSAANDIVLRAGFRALLIAPLLRGEGIVGMLVVRRRIPGTFPQNTIDLIKTFAAQSAVAIENARLFQNVETSLEDLRTTQDRLVQTQKLASLGQLTAGIAHEIKNPLNFVNNFSGVSVELIDELKETLAKVKVDADTLAEVTELTSTLRDNLGKIVQHGKRADSIVKNMLLHSREGSGEHRLVDANTLVDESLNLAYHGARAEKQGFNITLERSIDPTAGQVDCFPQEITRVLLNLISNGFYAATKRKALANNGDYEPTLTAATKNLGDRVEIRIRDNGIGIPPEVKEKIFNPFFTTKPAGEGTGLGLSISHDIIVKQHSGSIEIESRPGEYTEVRIVLPRAAAFPQQNQERQI
jgi:GAF domain-containing protein